MNRGIIILLVTIIVLGLGALYALQQGPALLLHGPSEERIAFINDRGGQTDIWTMRTDGSDARAVTNDNADDQMPSWSPDGKELVAASDRRGQIYQLFLSAWDGRYTHDLTSSEGTKDMPVWRKDGQEVTFISGGRLFGVKKTGGLEEQYLPLPGMSSMIMPGRSNFVYGAWAPNNNTMLCVQETDQGRIAYTADREDMESWTEGQLKTQTICMGRTIDVAWAPAGLKVAAAFIGWDGRNGVLVRDMDAVESKVILVSKGNTGPGKLAWSPDGKTLIFEMWSVQDDMTNRSLGIYAINASGGKAIPVVKGDAREPCWSPDGRKIAYTAIGKNGARDIWRVNSDGAGATNLTKGKGDSCNPSWSPDSRRQR